MPSEFDNDFSDAGDDLQAHFGRSETATYHYAATGETVPLTKTVAGHREESSYQAPDGTIYSRTVDVPLRKADLPKGVNEYDRIEIDGTMWVIVEIQDIPQFYMAVAARHERKRIAGRPNAAHDRPVRGRAPTQQ